jgi:carotenoid cleavage dioxygenase-like enzyme
MINEFTTAHPRVDPISNELLLYHMSFIEPFVRISVIPARGSSAEPLMGAPLPGMRQPKLAHDFCATATKTIFIDLPLSLDPRNLLSGKPMLSYESTMPTRFAIFPRREPGKARWYESQSCCIYHAANAWDAQTTLQDGVTVATTNLVACRLNSATLVYAAGNMDTPAKAKAQDGVEKCQLYYWQFDASNAADRKDKHGQVLREFALSNIPFEFPTMDENRCQTANRFVYGASMTSGSFDAGLGSRCAKIDCLAKVDIASLTSKGIRLMDEGLLRAGEAVDSRTVAGILASENAEDDDIAIFSLPPGHYAQEATFVSRTNAEREDDGFLIFFVFDERTGLDQDGRCRDDAQSQLWIVDARTMRDVVCKIKLPQRVPYGLHGHFFSEQEIASQRPVSPSEVRNWALAQKGMGGAGMAGTKPGLLVHGHQRVLATISDNIRHHVARLLA